METSSGYYFVSLGRLHNTIFDNFEGCNDESHLATISEIDSPFVEQCTTSSRVSVSVIAVSMKNAGCLGTGRCRLSLVSIITTFDMDGLSIGLAWTQSNPTWMHLITSFVGVDSFVNTGSVSSSMTLPAFHNSHAWDNWTYQVWNFLVQLSDPKQCKVDKLNL